MSDQGFTLVYYYIPEDLDELGTPNAYAIPKNAAEITLQDVESLFPLNVARGSGDHFHFRFKYKYNSQSVWLDLNNKKVKVPKCDGKIIMKVTRKTPKYLGFEQPAECAGKQNNIEEFF